MNNYCHHCTCSLPATPKFSIDILLSIVCDYFLITQEDICHHSRKQHLVTARHVFAYISNVVIGHKLEDVATSINRDHTTVVYGRESIRDQMLYNVQLKNAVEFLIRKVKGDFAN